MSCVAEANDREVLVRFARFIFSRLSDTEQCEKTDEIRQKITEDIPKVADGLPEEDSRLTTFTEVFEKLSAAEQNLFLSSEIAKYKQEGKLWQLFFWFQQLEADDQRELLEKLDPITPGNIQIPGTSDDDTKFRIDRFKQLPAGSPKIPHGNRDGVSIFILSRRSFIPQQDFASAEQLLLRLSTFGFSLLSPCDRKMVANIGNLYGWHRDDAQLTEEDLTMKSFTELYNAASFGIEDRVFLCRTVTKTFFDERRTREFLFYFRQLGTGDQENLIDELSDCLKSNELLDEDAGQAIIEKFSEESEEDFRDRRFVHLCVRYPSIWVCYPPMEQLMNGAGKWDLRDLHETSRYAKFLNGFCNIWAKARCPHDSRNLIQLIMDASLHDDMEKQVPQGDDIEKLPGESMEDFRVRRFTESFNRLQISSQMDIVGFIQETVYQDVGTMLPKWKGGGGYTGDRSSSVNDLIKFRPPDLTRGVASTTSKGSEVVDHLALDFE